MFNKLESADEKVFYKYCFLLTKGQIHWNQAYGAQPKKDLAELWKRIVFNMAVTNSGDYLRNHAFILAERRWTLSPLYDANPVPYGDELSLNINKTDNRISIDLALQL